MTKILPLVIVFAFAVGACLGVVNALVFDKWPEPMLSNIDRFQTIIGALLATIVAAFTAIAVFVVAKMPIDAERKQRRIDDEKDQRAGAAILSVANSQLANSLYVMMNSAREVKVPDAFNNFEIVKTQDPETVAMIGYIKMRMNLFVSINGRFRLPDDRKQYEQHYKSMFEKIDLVQESLMSVSGLDKHRETKYELGMMAYKKGLQRYGVKSGVVEATSTATKDDD